MIVGISKFKHNHMRSYILITGCLLLFVVAPCLLFAQNIDKSTLDRKADSLYSDFQEEEALDQYQKILDEYPRDYKALWRASFLHSRIGNRKEEQQQKEEYFQEARSLAEQALEIDSTDAQSHFVMSVAMGRMALISGARDRVAASRSIKQHADRALAIDSTHAGAWHVLGLWHYNVANLNFFERAAANTLFGGIPGDASNRKAAEAVEKAIRHNDRYLLYYHDLAMIYDEMGQQRKAIEACEVALDKEEITPDDPQLKEECRNWLSDWR